MPTYQYRCAKCGEQFELWQSIHDDALKRHPGCGGTVTKVMAPAGIVLKGSGFYRTDSRKAATASEGSSSNGSSSNGSSSNGSSSSSSKEGVAAPSSSPAPASTSGSSGSKAAN